MNLENIEKEYPNAHCLMGKILIKQYEVEDKVKNGIVKNTKKKEIRNLGVVIGIDNYYCDIYEIDKGDVIVFDFSNIDYIGNTLGKFWVVPIEDVIMVIDKENL